MTLSCGPFRVAQILVQSFAPITRPAMLGCFCRTQACGAASIVPVGPPHGFPDESPTLSTWVGGLGSALRSCRPAAPRATRQRGQYERRDPHRSLRCTAHHAAWHPIWNFSEYPLAGAASRTSYSISPATIARWQWAQDAPLLGPAHTVTGSPSPYDAAFGPLPASFRESFICSSLATEPVWKHQGRIWTLCREIQGSWRDRSQARDSCAHDLHITSSQGAARNIH